MNKLVHCALTAGFCSLLVSANILAADKAEAELFQHHLTRAQAGDVVSQFFVASRLDDGTGTAKDPGQAKYWYGKAAAQGHPLATMKLEDQASRERAEADAAAWAKQQAEMGAAKAQADAAAAEAKARQQAEANAAKLRARAAAEARAHEAKVREAANTEAVAKAAAKETKEKGAAAGDKVAASPRPQPSVADAPVVNALDVVLRGRWHRNQREVEFLPSSKTDCLQSSATEVVCFSHELRQDVDNSKVSYVVKATLSQFAKDATFNVHYVYNVIDVRKGGAGGAREGEKADVTTTPGWQNPGIAMSCKAVDDKTLSCTRDRKTVQLYSRM